MSENTNWIKVAEVGDIEAEEAIVYTHDGKEIAIFFVEDEYFATSNLCTHEVARLSEGYVDGTTIECPLHQGVFCLRSGKALEAPAEQPLATYPVKVEDDGIFIGV